LRIPQVNYYMQLKVAHLATYEKTMTTSVSPTPHTISQDPFTLLFWDLGGELKTTRRLLERVPDGKEDWRPHEKSMTLGALSSHIAQLPDYGVTILTTDEFDVATMPAFKPGSTAERLKKFDEGSGELRRLLQALNWDSAMSKWTFKFGDRVIVQAERARLMRTMVIAHIAHHRAQLGVYLRILGVPIPGSYGPSADEPMPMR
jgi:uncharacterized damage-inducible protein DinB